MCLDDWGFHPLPQDPCSVFTQRQNEKQSRYPATFSVKKQDNSCLTVAGLCHNLATIPLHPATGYFILGWPVHCFGPARTMFCACAKRREMAYNYLLYGHFSPLSRALSPTKRASSMRKVALSCEKDAVSLLITWLNTSTRRNFIKKALLFAL